MREHDDLGAGCPAPLDLLDGAVLPEAVLAVEWIVKNNYLAGRLRVVLELGEEERQGEGALVAGAQRIAEARLVEGGVGVAELNGGLVDENLVA